MFRQLIILTLITLLSACNTTKGYRGPSQAEIDAAKAEREARGIFNHFKLFSETSEVEFTYGSPTVYRMSLAEFEDFVNRQLTDQTIVTQNRSHGTQIEYYAPTGELALWYPGNQNPVTGQYRTKQSLQPYNIWRNVAGVLICFSYQKNSYNPVTGSIGGAEECTSAYAFLASIKGKRQGDVFELFSGKLPHVFVKGKPPVWPDGKPLVSKIAPHKVQG